MGLRVAPSCFHGATSIMPPLVAVLLCADSKTLTPDVGGMPPPQRRAPVRGHLRFLRIDRPETEGFRDDRTLGIGWLLLGCEGQCWRRPRPSVSTYSKAAKHRARAKMRLVAEGVAAISLAPRPKRSSGRAGARSGLGEVITHRPARSRRRVPTKPGKRRAADHSPDGCQQPPAVKPVLCLIAEAIRLVPVELARTGSPHADGEPTG
jgi:hypothetical protein